MNREYNTLTYRIFHETLEPITKNDDKTAERCYIASNEHLSEYMGDMDLTNKKIATVGSSGDQFFQALLQGCKDITIIDANPYTKAFVEYKRALFMNYDYNSMSDLIRCTQLFHWSTYAKISHDLSTSAKQFWDTLMLEQVDDVDNSYDQFDRNMIARQITHPEVVFLCDFYKNEECYKKLQTLLRKNDYILKFKTADLHDFPRVLKEKYDLIMLSNIFCYHGTGDLRAKFEKTVQKLYNKNLNDGGSIQVQYSYRKHYHSLDAEEIAGHKLRIEETGNGCNPRTVYFIDKPNENELSI